MGEWWENIFSRLLVCARSKLNYEVPVLAPRELILKPQAPMERSRCKLNYKVKILAPGALLLKPWAPTVGLQSLLIVFEAFQMQT